MLKRVWGKKDSRQQVVDGKIVDGLVRITKGHHIRKGRYSSTRFLNVKENVKQRENLIILTFPTKCVHVFPLSMYTCISVHPCRVNKNEFDIVIF